MLKKLRRSMLFCPANNRKLLYAAHLKGPDCIIFDLEDSVAFQEKDNAREMLCQALKTVDYGECEVFARVNSLNTRFGEKDVAALVENGIENIRLPMCECREDVIELNEMLAYYEQKWSREIGAVNVQCAIETPKGVINAMEIAESCDRVISISFGTADYTNCLCVNRSNLKEQFLYARSHIALCASVAEIDAIDTVYLNIKDLNGFQEETEHARLLGFCGKSCIHPLQIPVVHSVFNPNDVEIQEARRVIEEFERTSGDGIGVIVVDGKMVDEPIIRKAQKIIQLAQAVGTIK